MWIGLLLLLGALLGTFTLRARRRQLGGPAQLARALRAAGADDESPQEICVRLALTDRPDLEAARVEAVRTLGAVGDRSARPPLKALAEPSATFSSARLRRAARAALAAIEARHPAEPGRLSLTGSEPGRGSLSKP